jgi:hypothetical protein
MTSAQQPAGAPVVSETYLRDSLGITQSHPVTCHYGEYDGVRMAFHSHLNNRQRVGTNWQVTSFTVTARPYEGAIGIPGHHVTAAWQPASSSWRITVGDGIPPQTRAALQQLAEEIIAEMMEKAAALQDVVTKEARRKKDDDDRTNRKLRSLGFKAPGGSTGKAK